MADISKITLPSGTTYNLKDEQARNDIQTIQSGLAGGVKLIGTTTTPLTDGATTNPITINNKSVTAVAGNLVRYNQGEYLFDGTSWAFMGDLSSLGDLAYKDSASGSFTPAGSISEITFTGDSHTSFSGDYTPSGRVDVTVDGQTKNLSVEESTGTATYTPRGTISLQNSNRTVAVSKAESGTATYTPEGSVAAPTISVKTAGATTTVKNPTSVTVTKTVTVAAPGSTAPSNNLTYYNVTGETLSLYQIGYTTGASISTSNVTVKTGDAAYQASAPAFTGTGARLVTGNISVPSEATFTGTGVRLITEGVSNISGVSATFTGTAANISVEGTPRGTISQPTFTGTAGTVTVS